MALTIDALSQFKGLSHSDLGDKVELIIEDGSRKPLRENYLNQLHHLCNNPKEADTAWIRHDESSVYFLTTRDVVLRLVQKDTKLGDGESLHIVLDQSGSMHTMNEAVYAGARELVEQQPEGSHVTITTFNHVVSLGQRSTRESVLSNLTTRSTCGTTALRDAIVKSIAYEEMEPEKDTTIVAVTDGIDNASTNTVNDVKYAVQRAQSRGWRVLFLGANQDAVTTASAYGISGSRALTFGSQRAPEAFHSASENVRAYRVHRTDAFTGSQRQASSS